MHNYGSKIIFKSMQDDQQGPFTSREHRAPILGVNFLISKLKCSTIFKGNALETKNRIELNKVYNQHVIIARNKIPEGSKRLPGMAGDRHFREFTVVKHQRLSQKVNICYFFTLKTKLSLL